MKKRIVIIMLILLLLLVPIPTSLNDGGTMVRTSLRYKIVKWNKLVEPTAESPEYYRETSVYWFPDNFKSIGELWGMEMQDK